MRNVAVLIIALAFVAIPSFADNIPGELGFDLVPGSPYFDDSNVVQDADVDIDTAVTVHQNKSFKTLVRLNGTQDLMGVSFDFNFSNAQLNVKNIRETRADIDFNGLESTKEFSAVVDWFVANAEGGAMVNTFSYTYKDSPDSTITTSPGVVIDVNGDGEFTVSEFSSYVNEFCANGTGGGDVPFWTEVINYNKTRGDAGEKFTYNESVEVFDRVADINSTGVAEDNTVVLLARPSDGRDSSGVIVPGYGFTGNAILFEVEFKALSGTAGQTANIEISNAVGIDEDFQSLSDVKDIAFVNSAVTIIE